MYHKYQSNHVPTMCFFMLRNSQNEIILHGWSLAQSWDHIIRCEKSLVSNEYRISRSCNQFGNTNSRIQAEYHRVATLKEAWKIFYRIVRQQRDKYIISKEQQEKPA